MIKQHRSYNFNDITQKSPDDCDDIIIFSNAFKASKKETRMKEFVLENGD